MCGPVAVHFPQLRRTRREDFDEPLTRKRPPLAVNEGPGRTQSQTMGWSPQSVCMYSRTNEPPSQATLLSHLERAVSAPQDLDLPCGVLSSRAFRRFCVPATARRERLLLEPLLLHFTAAIPPNPSMPRPALYLCHSNYDDRSPARRDRCCDF